jgi:uncharacterized protein DUF1656
MLNDIEFLGAFVPGMAAWFVVSLAAFSLVDLLLTRSGFYRLFWHRALVRVALFSIFFCGFGLALRAS